MNSFNEQFEKLLDRIINKYSKKECEIMFRRMIDRLRELMDD